VVSEKSDCPECGSSNTYYRKTFDSWRCRKCKHEFSRSCGENKLSAQVSVQPNSEASLGGGNGSKKTFISWLGSIFRVGQK